MAWVTAAFAAGLSGVVVETTSYATLGILGAVLALVPLVSIARERRAVT